MPQIRQQVRDYADHVLREYLPRHLERLIEASDPDAVQTTKKGRIAPKTATKTQQVLDGQRQCVREWIQQHARNGEQEALKIDAIYSEVLLDLVPCTCVAEAQARLQQNGMPPTNVSLLLGSVDVAFKFWTRVRDLCQEH